MEAVTEDGDTALHIAGSNGHDHIVSWLLENTNIEIQAKDSNGFTALHSSALNGQVKTSENLLQAGALVDAVDDLGFTPLHWSIWEGHLEIVQLLKIHSASMEAVNEDGDTALHIAGRNGHDHIVSWLLENTNIAHWVFTSYSA